MPPATSSPNTPPHPRAERFGQSSRGGSWVAGAPSFAFCAKGGSVLCSRVPHPSFLRVRFFSSGPCSPPHARTHICHPEEVRPQVFMWMNDEPGSPAGAAFTPVAAGRGICFCFFGCPTRRSCVWVLVFCLPLSCMRVPHPSCPPYAQAELARFKTSRRVGRCFVVGCRTLRF
jgi:hypothetical protein